MRRAGSGTAGGFGGRIRPGVLASTGAAIALFITGCATQVAGNAVAPTSISRSSAAPTVASMPSGSPTETPAPSSSDETSSPTEASTDQTTSDGTSTPDGTTTSDGTSTSDETSSQPSSESSTGETGAPSGTIDPAAFAAKLKAANATVKSLKGSIVVVAGPVKVSGSFGETLSGGQVNALDMSMFVSEGSKDIPIRMLIVDGKVYLGGTSILQSLDAGTKKWALASKTSTNATLRNLADQLDGYLTTASANQYEQYAAAAKSIVDAGAVSVGGVSAHRYNVTVDVAALAKSSTGSAKTSMEALANAGVASLPTTLWLDKSNRVVQSGSTVKVSGVTTTTTFKVTGYNVPVTVKAPAPADVFTG